MVTVGDRTQISTLADQGGRARRMPPYGSRFFRFDIQNFRNIPASRVHASLRGPRPPTGNPGSATEVYTLAVLLSALKTTSHISNFTQFQQYQKNYLSH